MVSAGFQILGAALGILGWIGAIVTCALPMWRVTAFIGSNIVTSQTMWEGVWMSCVVQSTGQMQCKVYDSMLALTSDLQAARALMVISIVVGVMAILLAVAGGKCTNCVKNPASKTKVAIAAGAVFIIAGVLCLVPVCWTAHSVIRDFYNPLVVSAQKRELGAALYIGWGAAALMIIGGGMLCCNCPAKGEESYTARYSAARSDASAPASGKDFVSPPLDVVRDRESAANITLDPQASAMASQGLQMLAVLLAFMGWLGAIVTCALPMWRVTAFVGANIVTAQVIWEGLWMTCVVQSTGQMQCKVYDSMLALPQDLQAARAMVVVSVMVGVLGVLVAAAGGKCTNCVEDETAKAKACIVAGVMFVIGALLVMIPVSWSAHTVIRDFYNPLVTAAQRRELGAALYIGWGSAAMLLLGGGILCNNCPPSDRRPYAPAKFVSAKSASSNVDYV
ncbi:uncharacterized protein [Nerophis lumbriciformis]|uniref:uncharacterized protein n=1 Tax=Nerophis lumbriciformis TaxID=546530 RepID=UPI003BAA372C